MNRIRATFERLHRAGGKALIPYVTPEFPFEGMTLPLLEELEGSGADLIEVGIPFSDPLADGATIQHSSEVALKNGATISKIFDATSRFRSRSQLPVLLMGYINPILHFGVDRFLSDCRRSGVDGVIVPDLPPEEASAFKTGCERNDISVVFLIAPTTPDERIHRIDQLSTDFSYCVSVTGVTGERAQLGADDSLSRFLKRVRSHSTKPFVVGFGISNSEQVKRVWAHADGAVVGSALINVLAKVDSRQDALKAARKFLLSLRPSEGVPVDA
jgi:tryptophan synthase alpha chain